MLMIHQEYHQPAGRGRRQSTAANNGWQALWAEEQLHTWAMARFGCIFQKGFSEMSLYRMALGLRKKNNHLNPSTLNYLYKLLFELRLGSRWAITDFSELSSIVIGGRSITPTINSLGPLFKKTKHLFNSKIYIVKKIFYSGVQF